MKLFCTKYNRDFFLFQMTAFYLNSTAARKYLFNIFTETPINYYNKYVNILFETKKKLKT